MRRLVKFFTKQASRLGAEETGFSLVEELVAVGVLGIGLTLLIGMLSTGAAGVTTTQDRVTAEGLARSQLEAIKAASYRANPTTVPYPTVAAPPPYSVTTSVEYWSAPGGAFTTTVRNDGMQRVTVAVHRGPALILQIQDYKVNR
jgi:type II secretory pathway pseudopilin PulG